MTAAAVVVRTNPLLPVTEPCGSSVSTVPFSFTDCKVLLASQLCFGLSCLASSHSVPFSSASAAGNDTCLVSSSPKNGFKKKNNQHNNYVDNYLSIATCGNFIGLYLDSSLHRRLDQGVVWRHPYPRCPLLDQQANGRIFKKAYFDMVKMVSNVFTKKQVIFSSLEY